MTNAKAKKTKAKKAKAKKAKAKIAWRVLVEGKKGEPDKVVTMHAYSRDEAELDAADRFNPRWVRALGRKDEARR